MNQLIVKVIAILILFAIIISSGILIRRSGKPYRNLPFALHKLSGIGSIVLIILVFNTVAKNSAEPISMSTYIAIICFGVISLLSGAIQSIGNTLPRVLTITHRISSYFVLLLATYKLVLFF